MNVKSLLALGATAALLSACLSSGDATTSASSGTGQPIAPSETPLQLSEFSVANGCFGLQSAFSRPCHTGRKLHHAPHGIRQIPDLWQRPANDHGTGQHLGGQRRTQRCSRVASQF